MTTKTYSIRQAFPAATLEDRGLALALHGTGSPEKEPVLAWTLMNTVSADSVYSGGLWILPISLTCISALERDGFEMPASVKRRLVIKTKSEHALERANAWVEQMSPEQKKDWLLAQGVRFSAEKEYPVKNHQVTSIGWSVLHPTPALFLDTGLGKTFVGAHIIQFLIECRGKKRFLVVAPRSILRTGWGEDVDKFTKLTWMDIGEIDPAEPLTVCPKCNKSYKGMVPRAHIAKHLKPGTDMERFYEKYPGLQPGGEQGNALRLQRALKRDDIQIFLINPEQLRIHVETIKTVKFDGMFVDESSMMRSHESKTTEAILDVGKDIPYRCIMTATPRPNSSIELWPQFALLNGCMGHDFRWFRDKHFYKGSDGYTLIPRAGSDVEVARIVERNSLRFKLDDCLDMPGETETAIEVVLSSELREHYKDMLELMRVELEDDKVKAPQKLAQMNKLRQIASGFIYDNDGNPHYLSSNNPKLEESIRQVKQVVEAEGRSIVIWVQFPATEGKTLEMSLSDYGVSHLWGGMTQKEMEDNVKRFKGGGNKVMIAHPLSAKFGHTWVNATASLFHSYDFSWENYYQAKRRIYRLGQKNHCTHIMLVVKGTIDRTIMRALQRKNDASELVIDSRMANQLAKEVLRGKV